MLCIAMPMVIAIAIIMLYNFPSLFGLSKAKISVIAVPGPIIVVSDIHVGSRKSYYTVLRRLIERIRYTTVVIAGDLIDERIPFSNILSGLKTALEALGLERGRVIYVVSTASHDIDGYFEKPLHIAINNITISIVSDIVRIIIDGCSSYIYVTHGEYTSRDGVIAYILDRIGVALFKKSIIALIMRKALDIEKNVWVFVGHSHVLSIEPLLKVANTGSWDDRVYASAKPGIGVIRCIDNRLDVKFIKVSLKTNQNQRPIL